MARWLFLAVGALAGTFIVLKDRRYHFGLFHAVAGFVVLTALMSATVSRYPDVALLKVLSIFLLFLYAGTGARIAVAGRENRFFNGLLLGCEIFVGAIALLHLAGIEAMGNPNSLGEVMGVVVAPILLWGFLMGGEPSIQHRRGLLFAVCMYLGFVSHARAGLAAAFVSCGLLCLALRKYKMFIEGLVVLTIILAATAIFRPEAITSMTSSILYKGADQEQGILASRESPWRTAMDNIRQHPWFGTGLGTTAEGADADQQQARFSSNTNVTMEHGSSYLALIAGVGILGAVPPVLLLLMLIAKVFRTVGLMLRSTNAAHAAIPLAMVVVAGIVHAAFEDWMFAPGNYICVFFWCFAFILVDVTPSMPSPGFARKSPVRAMSACVNGAASIR
jgi:O-antigen ligase